MEFHHINPCIRNYVFKCKWSGCKWKDKQVYSFGWLCRHVKGSHTKVIGCVVLCLLSYRTIPFFLHSYENLMYSVILIVKSLWKRTIMFKFILNLNRMNFQFLILKVININWDAHILPSPYYGTTLHLPGDFFNKIPQITSPSTFAD